MTGQWAADPYGRAEYRWWDGANWTPHVSRGGQVTQEDAATFGGAIVNDAVVDTFAQVIAAQAAVNQAPVAQAPAFPVAGFPGFATPSGVAGAGVATRTNGMLITAAVLQLIQGIIGGIFGLWLLAAAQTDVGGLLDDITGGALTVIGLVIAAISAVLIVVSVQAMRRRRGAWITMVVLQSIATAFVLLGFFGTLGDSDGESSAGGAVIPLLYTGAALVLGIVGGRRQFAGVTR